MKKENKLIIPKWVVAYKDYKGDTDISGFMEKENAEAFCLDVTNMGGEWAIAKYEDWIKDEETNKV